MQLEGSFRYIDNLKISLSQSLNSSLESFENSDDEAESQQILQAASFESQQIEQVTSSDFDKIVPLSPFIKNRSHMESLLSVNNISFEELDRRAKPGCYSSSGFIGREENIKEVLRRDWKTVEKLGVKHEELAAHLTNIIKLANIVFPSDQCYHTIEYRTTDLIKNTIPSPGFQKIKVCRRDTEEMQIDLFRPVTEKHREVETPGYWIEENSIESEDYEENEGDLEKSKGVKLYLNSGILSYIHHLGFYGGGGSKNKYRVDPVKVMALLTGRSVDELMRTYNF